MRPTQVFHKANAAYEVAKIAAILFWLPLIVLIAATLYQSF